MCTEWSNYLKKNRYLVVLTLVANVAGCAGRSSGSDAKTTNSAQAADVMRATQLSNPDLRSKLLAMSKAEQKIRKSVIASGMEKPDEKLLNEMHEIDTANTARMKKIVEEFGWPGISMVGTDGATASFLIVQHADHAPEFQKSVLNLLLVAYQAGECSGEHLALLTDRVRIAEGRPQLYGTQVDLKNGKVLVKPVEKESDLDARRTELGLSPMDEYLVLLKKVYGLD